MVGNGVSAYYNLSSNYHYSNLNTLYTGASVFLPKNQSVLYSIQLTIPNLSNVSWNITGNYSTYFSGSSFFNLYMTSPANAYQSNYATVTLNANSRCGITNQPYNFSVITQGWSTGYKLTASPNHVKNNINVKVETVEEVIATNTQEIKIAIPNNNSTGITKMYLFNFNTNTLVKQWIYHDIKTDSYSLNIVGLKSGYYVLKMERNNKTTTTKIQVQ